MATIPMGNYGQAVAQPGQALNVPRQDVSSGLIALADSAQGIKSDNDQRQLKLDESRMRAQTALTLAKTTNDLHDTATEISRGVNDGSIPADQAQAKFTEAVGKITGPALDGYAPDQRMVIDAHLQQQQGTLMRGLDGVVQKRKQTETAATIDDLGEQFQRMASRQGPAWSAENYRTVLRNSGPAAGLNEAQISKMGNAYSERVHATFYENAATGALTNGDDHALGELVTKIKGPDGDALDPQKRAQLMHQVFGWQQHVIAQKVRATSAAEDALRVQTNEAVDLFNKGADISLGGGYLSPDFITQMTTTAAGTPMQAQVLDLIASQSTIAGFASKSAPQRAQEIERLRAARATPGVGVDPLGDKLLKAVETMDSKLRTAAEDNPWVAAQQAGRIQEAPQINAADPQSAITIMRQRMATIGQVEQWVGHKVSPLQPAEVEQISKMVRTMPLDQAATMLGSFGASMGNSDRVEAMAKQLHDKDGSLGLAMMYASQQTTQGRLVAELVLRGDQALRDKTVTIDKAAETGWQATIAKSIRGAFSNRQAEDAAVDAAFKIAAAKYAQNNSIDIPEAVRLATGGIVERNGQKFPLPYGMKEPDFDKALSAIKPADLAAQAPDGQVLVGRTPMALDAFVATLPKASLVDAGPGLYNVRAGMATVTNTAGKRLTLKVGP